MYIHETAPNGFIWLAWVSYYQNVVGAHTANRPGYRLVK
jgi:hypothetical protein